jgi:hypothetical protein
MRGVVAGEEVPMGKCRCVVLVGVLCGLGLAGRCAPSEQSDVSVNYRGCRAPDEPNCAHCCESGSGGSCNVRSSSPLEEFTIDPWYNKSATKTPCPEDCPPCARCTLRKELQLEELKMMDLSHCDCKNVQPVVDACYSPHSCECLCPKLLGLSEICGK